MPGHGTKGVQDCLAPHRAPGFRLERAEGVSQHRRAGACVWLYTAEKFPLLKGVLTSLQWAWGLWLWPVAWGLHKHTWGLPVHFQHAAPETA